MGVHFLAAVLIAVTLFWNVSESHLLLSMNHGVKFVGEVDENAQQPLGKVLEQKLDNFNTSDTRTFNLKYLRNSQFYNGDGPIIIVIGGINGRFGLIPGVVYSLGRKHKAMIYEIGHRYYGGGVPTEDLSTENLKYLSSEQALADLANFIRGRKQELSPKNGKFYKGNKKVIVIGGSYAGNLATWARLKYPDLVDAAWASSGPVLAEADFFQYFETVSEVIKETDLDCYNIISSGVGWAEKMLSTANGSEMVSKVFKTCHPIQASDDSVRAVFFLMIAFSFAGAVQHNVHGNVRRVCRELTDESGHDNHEKLAAYVLGDKPCMNVDYNYYIEELRIEDFNPYSFVRTWMYQTCTEFGYFMTTSSKNQVFGSDISLKFFKKVCTDVFGESITSNSIDEGISKTNKEYGGRNPNVTRVVTIHGSGDPWYNLGILKSLNNEAPVILIGGTSHCRDLFEYPEDPPELFEARNKAYDYINQWIQ